MGLYETMLKIRLCEESLIDPIMEGTIHCPVHLYTGEEAIAVGVCAALNKTDIIYGNHRSHGHFLAKGGSLAALLGEVYGKEAGCSRGRGGSMHLIDPEIGMLGAAPIVAGTVPLALGSALAADIRKSGEVAVSFFGDGATNEGVLFEALNFAALRKLPIVFVCENNLYATHMPIAKCRPGLDIAKITEPFGISNIIVDGNNVLDVYAGAETAVAMCRRGDGPFFIEARTYRMRGHVGPDDNIQGHHTDIRPESEVEQWRQKDPIRALKKLIQESHNVEESEFRHLSREIGQEISSAQQEATTGSYPKKSEALKYVFE